VAEVAGGAGHGRGSQAGEAAGLGGADLDQAGVAAQEIRPQARTSATDCGIRCVTLDYDAMRGLAPENTPF
jgi:hypothetical protein